jgi:putative sigma-54 modulation protein
MNIVVSGKQIDLTDSLKAYAEEKFSKLAQYFENILRVDITLSVEKTKAKEQAQNCEVLVSASGVVLRARESAVNLYSAIDLCLDKMESQIKKYHDKMKHREKTRKNKEFNAVHSILSPAIVDDSQANDVPQAIIKKRNFALKPMFVDEAAMQLNLLDQDFVVFNNAETDEVNVVYSMNDGNVGLIEPS